MHPSSRLEIDLTSINHNVSVIRRILARPESDQQIRLCAVVKADAYGLGAPRIATRLASAGIDLFAVYTPDEARALIEGAILKPILLMMPIDGLDRSDLLYRAAARGNLHLTVHDRDSLRGLAETADHQGIVLPLHVEIDTGMSRGGAHPDDALDTLEDIRAHPRLRVAGVYSHLATADSDPALVQKQSALLSQWVDRAGALLPDDCIVHEANTLGMLRCARLHRQMVRVGLGLLGFGPECMNEPDEYEFAEQARELRPCFTWVSRIIQTKWIKRGTPVGYGATFRAKRKMRLGLVPVGYADGYPRALSGRSQVCIERPGGEQVYVPSIGTISMDQLIIDLTDLPEDEIGVDREVEIVGRLPGAPNHLASLAREAGEITHEMLCRLNPRIKRTYISSGQTIEPKTIAPRSKHPGARAAPKRRPATSRS